MYGVQADVPISIAMVACTQRAFVAFLPPPPPPLPGCVLEKKIICIIIALIGAN